MSFRMWQKKSYQILTWKRIFGFRKIHCQQKLKKDHVHQIKFPIGDGYIAGKWWGDRNEEPIIGLHGFQDNAGTFDNLAPLLECRSLLVLEFPGHGLSSHNPLGRPYYYTDILMIIRRTIRDLGLNKASFLAHSFGSLLSYNYGGLYPKEVERIISLDCVRNPTTLDSVATLLFFEVDSLREWFRMNEKIQKTPTKPQYSKEKMIQMMHFGSIMSLSPKGCEIMMLRGAEKLSNGYAFKRDVRLKSFFLNRPLKETITMGMSLLDCHVLSINPQDSYLNYQEDTEYADMTFDLIKKPNSKKIVKKIIIPGTHHCHVNNPELVAPHINEFFKQTSY